MSAAQFTPGPWNLGRQRKIYARVQTPVAQSIAVNGNYPEALANARLIAAAPMLFDAASDTAEALELLQIGFANDAAVSEVLDSHLDLLRTALAKARGEQ